MRKTTVLFCLLLAMLCSFQSVLAKAGYKINITINGFEGDTIILAHYSADKQYVDDTISINKKGVFVAEGKESLKGGVYLVLLPPDNTFFQLLVDHNEQHFSIETDIKDHITTTKFEKSPQNDAFYQYMNFIGQKRKENGSLMKVANSDPKAKEKLAAVAKEVKTYKDNLFSKFPNSILKALLKGSENISIPEALNKDEKKRYIYYKSHYFDNINFKDDRLFRTPFLYPKITSYIEKLTPQHPDSINVSIDRILGAMDKDSDMFKFYVSHFLNEYAKSKVVGFDAVYVHLVETYYDKGMTPWVEEEQLDKIIKNAQDLKPLLIGKTAPNIQLYSMDKSKKVQLHQIESPYTVLYFYAPDCGHCKKATPHVKTFNEQFKDKGVKVIAVCSKPYTEEKQCNEYIKDNEFKNIWMNLWDPYYRFKKIYDLKTTPQIYVLDKDKKIISKKIGAEQLIEVMPRLMKISDESK